MPYGRDFGYPFPVLWFRSFPGDGLQLGGGAGSGGLVGGAPGCVGGLLPVSVEFAGIGYDAVCGAGEGVTAVDRIEAGFAAIDGQSDGAGGGRVSAGVGFDGVVVGAGEFAGAGGGVGVLAGGDHASGAGLGHFWGSGVVARGFGDFAAVGAATGPVAGVAFGIVPVGSGVIRMRGSKAVRIYIQGAQGAVLPQ